MITQYNPYATSGRKPVLFSRKQSANTVTAVFNGSGLPNRPMSNLLENKVRKLEKSELHGLIALFKMKPRVWRDSQMWGAIAVEILAPTFPFAKNLKEAAKPNKKLIDVFSKTVTTKLGAALLCSVKLTHTGAEVSIPLTVVADDLLRLYAAASTLPEVATEFFQSGGRVVDAEATVDVSSLKFAYLDKALQNLFRVLGGTLSIRTVAGMNRLILTLQVTKTQVEYMCNADFDEVRGIDLYGLVRTWCLGRTDPAIGLPRTTRPLKGIVATLPPGGQPRTDADGILIDADSSVLYLPPETNNVGRYDDSLAMTLINDVDGSFSQYDGATVKKLPKAQNVLLDWVNLKWSYVNNSGNLEVRDLSRAQPLNVTHIRKVIYSPIVKVDAIINFITRMSQWAGMVGGTPFNDFKSFMANAVDLINLNQDYEGTRDAELALYHIAELAKMYTNPSTAWQGRIQELQVYAHFVDNVRKIIAEIKKDEDKFFSMDTQSVLGVSMTMAFAIIFDKWAGQSDYVASQDTAKRAKYTNAHIDPNYKLPELPYVSVMGKVTPGMSKEQVDHAESLARGLMPHQANTTNLLRESPDNAILGVQAGGGKTMMIVVDILKEMQSGVKGPFLVLCPAHLVSQYVQEFTYATNGRVNVVAVTSYTLRRIGFTTLQKMIESAPINTVVVSDYNMAKGSSKTLKVGYGTASTQVYKVVEFLRQFNFQYAAMDESHKLKNQSATQTRAVAALVSDIPKKRLASGTFMDNSPSDIAGQFALLDPTVFGSVENFNSRYSADGGPGKIRQMRPGANLEINRTLKENCCYVQVKRKEWAAVLPPRKEEMHFVDLTPAQRSMYDSILTSSIEELTAAAAKNDSLAKVLGIGKYANLSGQDKDELLDELDEEGQSSDLSGGLDELLRPYLARLEQFMVAPAADKLGKSLQGGDRISPKVAKLVEIFNKHVYEDETPGKILVFTNQTASALALYDMLPENIKKQTIQYSAGRKDECGAEFLTNKNKVMMIGVSTSMDTGLNLQHCFPGDTYVMTDYDKCLKLEDVYNTDSVTHVLSYDLDSRKIERRPILQKTRDLVRSKDRYVAVKIRDLNTGVVTQQICTDNHPFILKGGQEVLAGDLQTGTKLITYGGDFRKLKIEPQSGEPVDSFTRVNKQCSDCGEWFDGTAMLKHQATAHGVETERYEEVRVVRSQNSAERFEDDEYRVRHSQNMKKVFGTPEAREAMSERGLASWENNEARRAAAAVRSAERWADPEFKAQVSSAISDFYLSEKGQKVIRKVSKKSQEFWASPEGKTLRRANADSYWTPERRKAKGEEFAAMWADEDMRDYILGKIAETSNDPDLIEFKSKMTSWLHANVEGYTEKSISAMLRAQGTLPNKPESNVIDLGIQGLEYTGDGKYFVTLTLNGKRVVKNPDFVSANHMKNGRTRKVVEVIGCREFTGRNADYVAALKQAYAAIGIECLVIDAKYCYEKSERFDDVKPLLESFVNNHYLEVLDVREVTNPNQIGKYKYDLTVEGNHNYFVVANLNGANSGVRPTTPVLVHNCSRLIRCETVMSPGALEQGNARIGRPNLKSKETRPFTFYDWILAANSIDVTKVAYLMTKKVRIAAVEEASNPIFAGMDVPELFSLSLDNITENNSRESLAPYLGPNGMYRDFLEREKEDFESFRVSNAHLLDANGKLKMVELQRGTDLTGSTIMRRVPYVPGLNIYGENELGLVRLDQFTKVEVKDEEEDADGAADGAEDDDDMSAEPEGEADDIEGDDDEVLISSEDAAKTQARQAKHDFMEKVKDVTVHTDMGEGVIHNATINRGRVRIRLNSGEFIYRSILSTFVITKPQTSMGDVRGSIAKMTGSIPIDTPWEVKPTKKVVVPAPSVVTKQVTKQHIDDAKELALNLVVTNDMIGLEYTNFSDKATTKTLRALKFTDSPQHYFASIRNYVVMNRFFKTLLEKGYDMPKPQLMLVSSFYYSWKAKGGKAASLFGMGTATQQKNFYVLNHKPVPGKKTCVPYVSCESNRVYLCLPSLGHPGNVNIAKTITNVPGVKFRPALPSIMRFFNSPSEAAAFVRTLLKTGYTLTNHNELHAEFTALRKEVPRATNKTMETFYDQKETTK